MKWKPHCQHYLPITLLFTITQRIMNLTKKVDLVWGFFNENEMPSFIPSCVHMLFFTSVRKKSYKISRKSRLQITSVIPSVLLKGREEKSRGVEENFIIFLVFRSLDSGILMGKMVCRYDAESYEVESRRSCNLVSREGCFHKKIAILIF